MTSMALNISIVILTLRLLIATITITIIKGTNDNIMVHSNGTTNVAMPKEVLIQEKKQGKYNQRTQIVEINNVIT